MSAAINEFTPLKLDKLAQITSTTSTLETAFNTIPNRLNTINNTIAPLANTINNISMQIDKILGMQGQEYQESVTNRLNLIDKKKGIVTIFDTTLNQPIFNNDHYSELANIQNFSDEFLEGSVCFILTEDETQGE